MDKLNFLLRLHLTSGISGMKKMRLYQQAKETDFWTLTTQQLAAINSPKFSHNWQVVSEAKLSEIKKTHRFITIEDSRYPLSLRYLPDPPLVLFYKGNLALLQRELIAVVGARKATDYSFQVLQKLVPELTKHRYVIVSGLARGVDGWAHQLAISHQGQTIAVIGTGLDVCYPRENSNLQMELSKNHLVLSEYLNGTPPAKFHFPARNRIIAGLSRGVLVTEAKKRSGTLITAQLALEYGKDVFAVPGSILLGQSTGCHQLIQDGALCVETAQDIFDALSLITNFA